MTTRLFAGLVVLALWSVSATAQPLPCTDGYAGEYACEGLDLVSHLSLRDFESGSGNDIWGWTDPETDREYALMGLRDGTGLVDVTDPARPAYLGKLPTATEPSLWRDIKVYDNHAFVVSEAPGHGMQVFDLTQLRGLSADPDRRFEAGATFVGTGDNPLGSAHNIVMNETSGYAYAVGANECAGGLYMINVQDPMEPSFEGCFAEDGYSHDAQCVTYAGPDTDYTGHELCVGSNEDTITIVDVTDKSNPVELGKGSYPTPAYTHQGWFTEDHRYFIVDDELDEIQGFTDETRTFVFDLADLSSPELMEIYTSGRPFSDHNLYVHNSKVYQANYTGGLRVLDASRVGEGMLEEVASFDIYPETDAAQFNGAWSVYPYFASGTVIVSGIEGGLFVLRPSSSSSLSLSRFDAMPDGGAAEITWVAGISSGEPYLLQSRHGDAPFKVVGTVDASAQPAYRVEGLAPGTHAFRLVQLGADGGILVSAPITMTVAAPDNFRVSRPYPNGHDGTLQVALTVAQPQHVRVEVVDGEGDVVKMVHDGPVEAGKADTFEVFGPGLPSDSYMLRVTGDTFSHEMALASMDTSLNQPGR